MVPGGHWHSAGAAAQFGRELAALCVGLVFAFVAASKKAAMEKMRASILNFVKGMRWNEWLGRNGWRE